MKVIVSQHYNGRGWYDPRSGINFRKEFGVIEIPDDADMLNISRHLVLGYLDEVLETEVERPKVAVTSSARELLDVEEPSKSEFVEALAEETKLEEIEPEVKPEVEGDVPTIEAPKKRSRKKKPVTEEIEG